MKPPVSVIVPAHNEEKNVGLLCRGIRGVLRASGFSDYEIILVDDGSTDNTFNEMKSARQGDRRIKIVRFRTNFGKSSALQAGFCLAEKDVVVTMDADLQDEPREIPRFVERLSCGYDVVSGWKYRRKDPITKTLPSAVFNLLARLLTGLRIHDFNCGFKAYTLRAAKEIRLYGEMHRYIPALAAMKGFKVGEIKVTHNRRRFGRSKYGFSRLFRGTYDLITVTFFRKYSRRPLHFFGAIGALFLAAGFATGLFLVYEKITGSQISDRPLLFFSMLLIIVGTQFVSLGLLAELIIRNRGQEEYVIDEVIK